MLSSIYASEVLSWWQEIHGSVSLDIELVAIGQTMPIDGEIKDVIIVHALIFENDENIAQESLKPFLNCPKRTFNDHFTKLHLKNNCYYKQKRTQKGIVGR